MKYNEKNKPLVCMQTTSNCYKGTTPMTVLGVLWHSTGANNPNLKRYVQPSDDAEDRAEMLELLGTNINKNDWNHISRQAGLNAWIGKLADGTVTTVQTMPWTYRPWGCGSGSKGSCNYGWIQFEICEAELTNKDYFEKIYNEACELTAYLCEMFNIDPQGTVEFKGVQVPTILCHGDANKLGLGSAHVDINHWFPKFGKSMETVREDVAKLLKKPALPVYYIRKDWEDAKSQIGTYTNLETAKAVCDKAGKGYEVYDESGKAIYPEAIVEEAPVVKVGDTFTLASDAIYANGASMPDWVKKSTCYVREIRKNGNIVFSVKKTGAVTGVIKASVIAAVNVEAAPAASDFVPYTISITANSLNVRAGAGTSYKVIKIVKKNQSYTVVAEKNGWGQLKNSGWINLKYAVKV